MGKRGDGRRPGWKKGMERKWQHASAERILREMHEAGCSSASGSRTIRRDVHPAPPFLRQRSRLKDTWRCSHEPCTLTSKWRWKFHASRVQALHFWKLINQHFTRWNESYVNEYRELSMKIRFWFERFAFNELNLLARLSTRISPMYDTVSRMRELRVSKSSVVALKIP